MPSPVPTRIELTAEERAQLEAWERRRTSAQALALRSRIVLAAAEGPANNTEIARSLGVAVSSVRKWRNRFAVHRLDGLTDEPRPGQPRTITDAQVEEVIVKTLETTPKDATHWSTRSMAAEVGPQPDRRAPHLEGVRAPATSPGRVEAVHGSAVH
jgi:transposase